MSRLHMQGKHWQEAKSHCQDVYCIRLLPTVLNLQATISFVLCPSLLFKVPALSRHNKDNFLLSTLALVKMPPIAVDVQQKGKPWPGYFLVRTTGEVVPLIAVDELPTSIELVGIPRSLDLEETTGMLNLGLQRSTGGFYQIALEHGSKFRSSEAVEPE
jgi:hypothetical protein